MLYADWLLDALHAIDQAPKIRVQYFPEKYEEIETTITEIAEGLVLCHAGRQTLQDINHNVGLRQNYVTQDPQDTLSTESEWTNYLVAEAERMQKAGRDLSQNQQLMDTEIIERFDANLENYLHWSRDISTVRHHFSGKLIFQALAERWQPESKGAKYSWEILRNETLTFAIEYCKNLVGELSDDDRFGDFGLLARKTLGLI